MALAIRIDSLAREGALHSYSGLAEAGQISRSRMSQIRRLNELGPSIQEELLFLPKIMPGVIGFTNRRCEALQASRTGKHR
jgi:hypothetical protein